MNLVDILKNCPKGTRLWSDLAGEVEFIGFNSDKSKHVIFQF